MIGKTIVNHYMYAVDLAVFPRVVLDINSC